jgi:hypothetical protein
MDRLLGRAHFPRYILRPSFTWLYINPKYLCGDLRKHDTTMTVEDAVAAERKGYDERSVFAYARPA